LPEEDNDVTDDFDPLPDGAILAGQVKLAQRAHELGIDLTPRLSEELTRAALDGAASYLDGGDPDQGWPPLPDPES
jgi:hypothetical protein